MAATTAQARPSLRQKQAGECFLILRGYSPKGPRTQTKGSLQRGSRGIYRGCKGHPNSMVLGPKYYNINGIWALKPHYLGPWTLRACLGLGLLA